MTSQGVVISVHHFGAMARLEDGTLAAISPGELAAHRPTFVRSLQRRELLAFHLERSGKRAAVRLADAPPSTLPPPSSPGFGDAVFEARMNAYLKSTEEWAPADRPPPAERHFIRKKRRAAFFEARSKDS
ncbi:MAG: hypothetical protein GIW95_02065 [Candidatus Eremiobacteraeota bacterium]|nr:hypothetical protein [Candidatus Eremiobacteraeota bacterium]